MSPAPSSPPVAAESYVRDLTDEQLAEELRPVVLNQEGSFRARNAPIEMARRIRETLGQSIRIEGRAPLDPTNKRLQGIFGADDRRTIDNTAFPWRTVAFLEPSGCTATFIGWTTAISAAHCVAAKGGWKSGQRTQTFRPGAKGTASPFGTVAAGVSGCGGFAIPQAYLDTGDRRWDFAVYDFTNCTSMPTWQTGYSGIWVNAPIAGKQGKLYGYPAPRCPDTSVYPSNCGMSGGLWYDDYVLQSTNIDSSGGQSGGPWMSSDNYLIGSHCGDHTWSCGFLGLSTCRANEGRRLDTAYWSFIQGYVTEY
ncbi:MAG: hypothetical protein SFV15_25660 [Polyangiaceae bacterium]|nr:hypothetical protein [Polyangiaceae bacterium]